MFSRPEQEENSRIKREYVTKICIGDTYIGTVANTQDFPRDFLFELAEAAQMSRCFSFTFSSYKGKFKIIADGQDSQAIVFSDHGAELKCFSATIFDVIREVVNDFRQDMDAWAAWAEPWEEKYSREEEEKELSESIDTLQQFLAFAEKIDLT